MLECQLSPEVHSAGAHETADQQLGSCSPEEESSLFPILNDRAQVLPDTPLKTEISFFFLQSKDLSSFSTMDMFSYVLAKFPGPVTIHVCG